MYMYKDDLPLNNLQWLIYHKTQPNQKKILMRLPKKLSYIHLF